MSHHPKPNHVPARILLVDDEAQVLLTLKAVLAKLGYDVTTAGDYGQAHRMLRDGVFDLLVTDLRLNDQKGHGLLLAGEAKRMAYAPGVVLMTGYPADIENSADYIRENVDEYLFKPLGVERLFSCIKRALEKRAPVAAPVARSAGESDQTTA